MGTNIVIEVANLEARARQVDLIITGEGATDKSTPFGKVPAAMGLLAKHTGIRCVCVSGSIIDGFEAIYDMGVTAVFSIVAGVVVLAAAAFYFLKRSHGGSGATAGGSGASASSHSQSVAPTSKEHQAYRLTMRAMPARASGSRLAAR